MHLATLLSSLSLLFLALFSFASAIPAPSPANLTTEHWTITRMDLHFMTDATGLPWPSWPEWAKFDSTIDFDISLPAENVTCKASWPNGKLPNQFFGCEAEQEDADTDVKFAIRQWDGLGQRRPEMAFTVGVMRTVGNLVWAGTQNVSANNPKQSTSHLTCMLGRPLDGMRCTIHGMMSVRDMELFIDATSTSEKQQGLENESVLFLLHSAKRDSTTLLRALS